MAMTEDLSVFFSDADFAESVVLDGTPVLGIFDNAPAMSASVNWSPTR